MREDLVVLITGSRKWKNREIMDLALSPILSFDGSVVIIEGGAAGADRMAQEWAKKHKRKYRTYMANWDLYGKKAGFLRNEEMLQKEKPDIVIGFHEDKWLGKGTRHMIEIAALSNTPYEIYLDPGFR